MVYVEPRLVEAADFPHSEASTPAMRVIEADPTPRHGSVRLDVPYAVKSGRTLHLQVILPPRESAWPDTATDTYPTVVYVQGSAWHEQDLGQSLPALAGFARRGYVVVIVEYRPSELAPFPAQVKDVRTAVRWVRDHAAELHVDTQRMAMWGDSSGGHTTLMTYVTSEDPAFSDEPDGAPLGLRCYVDYFGLTDISRMNEAPSIQDHTGPTSPEGMLIGGLDVLASPETVAPTVVMSHVPAASQRRLPPLLTVHGSKDRIVPFAQSVLLHEALAEAGQEAVLYQLRGADHGGPPFWQDEVLDVVDAFLRENLRADLAWDHGR